MNAAPSSGTDDADQGDLARPVGDPPPRPVGFVAGTVSDAFFEPLPDDELEQWA